MRINWEDLEGRNTGQPIDGKGNKKILLWSQASDFIIQIGNTIAMLLKLKLNAVMYHLITQ